MSGDYRDGSQAGTSLADPSVVGTDALLSLFTICGVRLSRDPESPSSAGVLTHSRRQIATWIMKCMVLAAYLISSMPLAAEKAVLPTAKPDLAPLQRLLREYPEAATPLAVKIHESGYINSGRRVFWLDNQRVMFQGYLRGSRKRGVEDSSRSVKNTNEPVQIWNYKTRSIEQYVDGARALCYHRGVISYVRDPIDSEPILVTGRLGREKKAPIPPVTDGIAGFDKLRCELSQTIHQDFERRTGIKYHKLLVLQEEHGLIDRGPGLRSIGKIGDPAFHAKLYRPKATTGIELYRSVDGKTLPIRFMHFQNDVYGLSNYYFAFANVYLFYSPAQEETPHFMGNWPKGLPYPVHIFRPSGETETIKLPAGAWDLPAALALTKKGIYLVSEVLRPPGSPRPDVSGGFVIAPDGRISHLVKGSTNVLEISPDGCKAATGLRTTKVDMDLTAYEMKVVELCEGAIK